MDPVIIFSARKLDGDISQRSIKPAKVLPQKIRALTIGIDDNDADDHPLKKEGLKIVEQKKAPVLAPTLDLPKKENIIKGPPGKGLTLTAPSETMPTKRQKPTLQLGP